VTSEGGLVTQATAYVYNDQLVKEYQFVQRVPGHVVLRIVPEDGVTPEDLQSIAHMVNSPSGGLMRAELEIVDAIPTTPGGKRRLVEQHLDLAEFSHIDDR
jgi:hypothetical protein